MWFSKVSHQMKGDRTPGSDGNIISVYFATASKLNSTGYTLHSAGIAMALKWICNQQLQLYWVQSPSLTSNITISILNVFITRRKCTRLSVTFFTFSLIETKFKQITLIFYTPEHLSACNEHCNVYITFISDHILEKGLDTFSFHW